MNRLVILFVTVLAPGLAALLAWLGLKTLHENLMGWFLFITGLAYFLGTLILYWIRRVPFWNPNSSGSTNYEERSDLSFWLLLPGMLVSFFISPVEYLWLPVILPRNLFIQIFGLFLVVLNVALTFWAHVMLHARTIPVISR